VTRPCHRRGCLAAAPGREVSCIAGATLLLTATTGRATSRAARVWSGTLVAVELYQVQTPSPWPLYSWTAAVPSHRPPGGTRRRAHNERRGCMWTRWRTTGPGRCRWWPSWCRPTGCWLRARRSRRSPSTWRSRKRRRPITAGGPSTAGWRSNDVKRLKELETENARLKRIVADKELQIEALKELGGKLVSPARWRAPSSTSSGCSGCPQR